MAVFSEAFLRLRQELDQSHDDRRKLIEDIRNDVRELAEQTGNQIAQQSADRRQEFTTMIGELRGSIRQQAEQTRGELADLAADLRQGGAVFAQRQKSKTHPAKTR